MTPLEIEIMLHYHSKVSDYRDGDLIAPAVETAIEAFVSADMLKERHSVTPKHNKPATLGDILREQIQGPRFAITEKGRAYVEALKTVPMPVEATKWVVPMLTDGEFR